MKSYIALFLCLLFSSCSLFRFQKVSEDIPKESQKICLNSSGKGRIEMEQGKYVFSYESALVEEEEKFIMVLNFPIYGEEKFEIYFTDGQLRENNSELEHRLIATGSGVDPLLVQSFISLWAKYFKELISLQRGVPSKKASFEWMVKEQTLMGISNLQNLQFISKANVANKDFFEHLTFQMKETKNKSSQSLKVELFVRECLEKLE